MIVIVIVICLDSWLPRWFFPSMHAFQGVTLEGWQTGVVYTHRRLLPKYMLCCRAPKLLRVTKNMSMCLYVYIYIYTHISLSLSLYVYIYTHNHTYIYIYICYTHIIHISVYRPVLTPPPTGLWRVRTGH